MLTKKGKENPRDIFGTHEKKYLTRDIFLAQILPKSSYKNKWLQHKKKFWRKFPKIFYEKKMKINFCYTKLIVPKHNNPFLAKIQVYKLYFLVKHEPNQHTKILHT